MSLAGITSITITDNVALPGSIQNNNVHIYSPATTEEEINKACLKKLDQPTPLEAKEELKSKDKLLDELIEWILKDPRYEKWQTDKGVFLLWIKGGAGKGKTMMSIGLIEQLEQASCNRTSLVAYFFCQNAKEKQNNLVSVLKGLITCLVEQQKDLYERLRCRWDSKNGKFTQDLTSWHVLWCIFKEMLMRCKTKTVYVVIDALDECPDKEMAKFLRAITRTGFMSNVKWLVTSRPFDIATRELLGPPDQVAISLDEKSEQLAGLVRVYIAKKTSDLDRLKQYPSGLREQVEKILAAKAEGTYLWVSLVCKRLENVRKNAGVLAAIETLPPGLKPFYQRILYELCRKDSDDESVADVEDDLALEEDPDIVEENVRFLKTVLTVYHPVKQDEILSAIGLQIDDKRMGRLVERCASFITKQGDSIGFVHESAREFLMQEGQATLSSYERWEHIEIALSCVSCLSEELKVNLGNLPRYDSGGSTKRLQDVMGKKRSAKIRYAATFWARHLADAIPNALVLEALGDRGKVTSFLDCKLLEWFECLSLLNRLPHAVEALSLLVRLIKASSPLLSFVQDATRFLLQHYSHVTMWPLQLYSSAITLSPKASLVVRKATEDKKPPRWLKAFPQVKSKWEPLVQTLRGHSLSVTTVVFSQDGTCIASSSQDSTIRLWSATTGDHLKTLGGHLDCVTSVAFLPDNQRIVSGSFDQTVKLWDLASGECQMTLKGHEDSVTAVAVRFDGEQIASASSDKTIKLWDTKLGKLQETLKGHSDAVTALAFTRVGTHIASASSDQTIKVWDITTSSCEMTLKGHFGSVRSVAVSPDGRQIASVSYDKTVRLWDAATGKLRMTLEHPYSSTTAVAFSPDSLYVTSGCHNTVYIWNTTTGVCTKTLKGHSGVITAVTFSPNSTRIASSSDDQTINLWDSTAGEYEAHPVSGHSNEVIIVVFSLDGRYIASGSYDNTVKLWNTSTGAHATFRGHFNWVHALAFSHDGKTLASGSGDKAIRLWNTSTGACKTLEGHSGTVTAVAFSPNGKYLASASVDRTVMLWDTDSGSYTRFEGHSDWTTTVSFSPDGRHVASGSDDKSIRLWDLGGTCKGTLRSHSGSVTAVAWSADGAQLASASHGRTVRLWDVSRVLRRSKFPGNIFSSHTKATVQREMSSHQVVTNLRYSENGETLITNVGALSIGGTGSNTNDGRSRALKQLWVGDMWLCYGTTRLLRLASDSQPRCQDTHDDRIAIGLSNGQVLMFEIDREMLDGDLTTREYGLEQYHGGL
ncbi:hypothetical protein E8E13_011392 [Curvularia kusanoi]|uniref:Mitochondrial division protein 1 n=1 Tax=Curvularia kusanoi TaxID=90978 RepID=A0A9P4TLT2_CURKU|nr:hypothetical protein E8E13_011392 [Curvularia kusanoi]